MNLNAIVMTDGLELVATFVSIVSVFDWVPFSGEECLYPIIKDIASPLLMPMYIGDTSYQASQLIASGTWNKTDHTVIVTFVLTGPSV